MGWPMMQKETQKITLPVTLLCTFWYSHSVHHIMGTCMQPKHHKLLSTILRTTCSIPQSFGEALGRLCKACLPQDKHNSCTDVLHRCRPTMAAAGYSARGGVRWEGVGRMTFPGQGSRQERFAGHHHIHDKQTLQLAPLMVCP